jgi:chaperone protein EcpD
MRRAALRTPRATGACVKNTCKCSKRWWLWASPVFWAIASSPSQAGVVLNNTRLVFDGSKKEASLTVSNPTTQNYAIQAWVNTAQDDDTQVSPFMATPPLFRLDSRKEQGVRILDTGAALPADRESLFYFNVQEIPAASSGEANVLKVALRTRIKLFYRPAGLNGSAALAGQQLQWSLMQHAGQRALQVSNPTPFHVSFIGIKVTNGEREHEIQAPLMVAPFATRAYPLDSPLWQPHSVVFSTINDHGGYSQPSRVSLPGSA